MPSLLRGGLANAWERGTKSQVVPNLVDWLPNSLERGTKSATGHKSAEGLHQSFQLRSSQRFKAGDIVSNVPQVGGLPTLNLPFKASPTRQSRGRN